MSIVVWRGMDELHARKQGWEGHARKHYAEESGPMSARDAYFAGWKDRAEWGYQELPGGEERK